MINALSNASASVLRITLLATLMLGPIAGLGFAIDSDPAFSKGGAGLVLFVSLQRGAMS